MENWNKLSIREKAAFIKAGVKGGLKDLSSIRNAYNSFATGGNIFKGTLDNKSTYNKKERRWYNSKGQKMYHGHGYWSEKTKTYTVYNADGTYAEVPKDKWEKAMGITDLNIASTQVWDNINKAIDVGLSKGLTENQAIAVAANMFAESGGKPIKQKNGPAVGYFQLEENTKKKYDKFLQDNNLEDNVEAATSFVVDEFNNASESIFDRYNNYYKKEYKEAKTTKDKQKVDSKYEALKKLADYPVYKNKTADYYKQAWNTDNLDAATTAFMSLVERPGKPKLDRRKAIANYILQSRYSD